MVESLSEKKEYVMIDYFRIMCAIAVVALHLKPLEDINRYADYFLSNVLTRVCVPYFFVASGYFLSNKINEWSRVKIYVTRILRLYLVYSLIYLPQNVYKWIFPGGGR